MCDCQLFVKPTNFMAATSNKIFEVSWINVIWCQLRVKVVCLKGILKKLIHLVLLGFNVGPCLIHQHEGDVVYVNFTANSDQFMRICLVPVLPNSHLCHSIFLILKKRSDIQNVTMIWYRFRFKTRRGREVWCISSKWIESVYLFLDWLDSIH